MLTILLIGFLLILGLSLIVLNAAIERANEGHEDPSGFHQQSPEWKVDAAFSDSGTLLRDQRDGRAQLAMRSSFEPIGNPPFNPNEQ